LGPSGSGKSQLAEWAEEDLQYLKIEVDQYSKGGVGIDGAGLRPVWDQFHDKAIAGPIAAELRNRIAATSSKGAIITLPSGNVFPPHHIQVASSEGIAILILYGPQDDCIAGFLKRERELKRGFDNVEHWNRNNLRSHAEFSKPEYAGVRISAFTKGARRLRAELIEDVRRHLANEK